MTDRLPIEHRPSTGDEDENDGDVRMTFTEHLGELRLRIMWACGAVLVAVLLCYPLSRQIFHIVAWPLRGTEDVRVDWTTLDFLEGFVVRLKLTFYAGLLLASPVVLYQACAFVFPGLRKGERRAIKVLLTGGAFLAITGATVAYFAILPLVLPYILRFTPEGVVTQLQMSRNVALLLRFYVGFAIAFQFPMVVLVLVYLDLLSPATLRAYRKVAMVMILAVGALLTPPDPLSMMMLAGPLMLLYEVSIWLAYIVKRRKKAA